jgi:inhibitor of cysteine peptidase
MKSWTVALAALLIFCLIFMIQPCTAREITAGETDSGRVISSRQNDIITISLPENPSTGYIWEMKATTGLSIISETFVRSSTKLIGAGGTHIWKYQVTGTGTQSITGVNHRPWILPSPRDRKFSLSVQVDSPASTNTTGSCPYGVCKQGLVISNPIQKKMPVYF